MSESEICLKVIWVSCRPLKSNGLSYPPKPGLLPPYSFRHLVLSDPTIKDCVSGVKVLAGLVPEMMMALAGAEMRVVLLYFCSLCLG